MARKLEAVDISQHHADPDTIPAGLGPHGRALWCRVTAEYDLTDSGGAAMLEQACRSLDRAETCRESIDRDGEMLKVRGGPPKEHPLLKHELQNRAFTVRTLQRLGLNFEPIRNTIGRPPGGM